MFIEILRLFSQQPNTNQQLQKGQHVRLGDRRCETNQQTKPTDRQTDSFTLVTRLTNDGFPLFILDESFDSLVNFFGVFEHGFFVVVPFFGQMSRRGIFAATQLQRDFETTACGRRCI